MRKYLFLVAAATVLGFSSCSEEDCNHAGEGNSTIGYSEIAGSWYDPIENEEVKYTENGTFHDKYANNYRASHTEGRYEINANKLTYTYKLMGQNQFSDFTLTDYKPDYSITLYSDKIGKTVLYRISNVVNLDLGAEAELPCSGLESTDSRIVSIDGTTAKSNGMKGTVYLKNAQGTYVKVMVGNDIDDLWMDYSKAIGLTVAEMKDLLGTPDELTEKDAFYTGVNTTHDMIKYVGFSIENGVVVGLGIFFKAGISEEEIINYLKDKYFYNTEMGLFTSHKSLTASIFVAQYKKDTNTLIFQKRPVNIPDYTVLFAKSRADIDLIFTGQQPLAEAKDSVRYAIPENSDWDLDYASFYFRGKGRLMNSFAVHCKEGVSPEDVTKYLNSRYEFIQEIDLNGKKADLYQNSGYTYSIFHYRDDNRIEYYDLNQQEITSSLFQQYLPTLGMTKTDFESKYPGGYPYKNVIFFDMDNQYAKQLYFVVSDNSIISKYFFVLNDDVDMKALKEELNGEFHFLNTNPDKAQTTWINTENREDATIGVQLYENDKQLYFFYLGEQ